VRQRVRRASLAGSWLRAGAGVSSRFRPRGRMSRASTCPPASATKAEMPTKYDE